MKGVKYNLVFRKPDNSVINILDQSSADLIKIIPYLFQTHYFYPLTITRPFINTLNTRPALINKFVRDKLTISRTDAKVNNNTSVYPVQNNNTQSVNVV